MQRGLVGSEMCIRDRNMIRSVLRGVSKFSHARSLSFIPVTRSYADGRTPKPDPRMMETTRFFLDPADYVGHLQKCGIDFFSGVPDSLLRQFCSYLLDSVPCTLR
eukprot:TRINITY_DN30673_c0_g1_i2.p1 TRINITY_DN30673_c0_g1~~TRINITY_DN30673_c0_g1_i2.p1  ORF type:complete len:105 (+),score=10.59 TRINITY_DN30673_c0_g1_i2:142-456(+)